MSYFLKQINLIDVNLGNVCTIASFKNRIIIMSPLMFSFTTISRAQNHCIVCHSPYLPISSSMFLSTVDVSIVFTHSETARLLCNKTGQSALVANASSSIVILGYRSKMDLDSCQSVHSRVLIQRLCGMPLWELRICALKFWWKCIRSGLRLEFVLITIVLWIDCLSNISLFWDFD